MPGPRSALMAVASPIADRVVGPFNPSPGPYFRGVWSFFSLELLSVTSETVCTEYRIKLAQEKVLLG